MAVTEISKIASSFLPFGSEEEEPGSEGSATGGAVGVTEEVLAFARNISMHPETWLDFPLFTDDEDSDGMSSCFLDRILLLCSFPLIPTLGKSIAW